MPWVQYRKMDKHSTLFPSHLAMLLINKCLTIASAETPLSVLFMSLTLARAQSARVLCPFYPSHPILSFLAYQDPSVRITLLSNPKKAYHTLEDAIVVIAILLPRRRAVIRAPTGQRPLFESRSASEAMRWKTAFLRVEAFHSISAQESIPHFTAPPAPRCSRMATNTNAATSRPAYRS